MADALQPDELSSLARRIAERIATLCPHVPAGELASLTSRLALAEHAHATGVSFDVSAVDEEPESLAASGPGNRVVWLPGRAGSAIVLPAGEEPPSAGAAAVQLLLQARRVARPLRARAVRLFRDTLRSCGRYGAERPTRALHETSRTAHPVRSR